ncbi:glycoside hydrolase family 43 protein [Pseudoroseicyclus tamaricis]|uniref:Glycoside hydrolase family 43 protein n=1 Tax=Pseudoroseicyclus tamaricis TaxID=2705421 RepID=A0A6B2K1F7_9RHOB|nr:glycoside hydrolase family 43 protein [Pseudoroseicyclus tamaricis]NDV00186.1 glycoside hydrolase family 43 protein [Pseudoroseicyclus tamaricis]
MRQNPILPGFHPDPSIVRVGEWYYLATSTFEWFPGVRLHRSRDLSNWELVGHALDRADQLDMRGNPDSGGVWAPCLTHAHGRFWLVYTNMRRHQGSVKDAFNYVVTAESIEGPWSAPAFLNASGFDPSLFHDEDGRSWLLQMYWSHEAPHFAGIWAQEFDREAMAVTGERHLVFEGTDLALTEGPHVYKRNGWYHLLTAEGGTGYGHACTWARSRSLLGPYELHPQAQILTSKDDPDHPIQRAGHGDVVEAADGRTWLVHLMGRPLEGPGGDRRCVLGRETGIQECEWRDDWLWVKGGPAPSAEVDLLPAPPPEPEEFDFKDGLPKTMQWLRTPEPERLFTTGAGGLTLFGRESIGSFHEQALVARRQTEVSYRAETEVSFDPADSREQAGLTAYYSRHALYFLHLTRLEGRRVLRLIAAEANSRGGTYSYPGEVVAVPDGPVKLAVEVARERLWFEANLADGWRRVGPELDATILSDEASVGTGGGCFTGAFAGVCCVDMNGHARPATFPYFRYHPRPD